MLTFLVSRDRPRRAAMPHLRRRRVCGLWRSTGRRWGVSEGCGLAREMLEETRPIVAGYCGSRPVLSGAPPSRLSAAERLNDEIQARVYMARRIHADAEFARQNSDQGIRLV